MENEWHLDKRVPVTLIILLAGQIAFGAWWVAKTEGRITSVEEKYIELAHTVQNNKEWQVQQRIRVWDELNQVAESQSSLKESFARLQGQLEIINHNIQRVLDKMEGING